MLSTAAIDAGVERMHDRALARYERQVADADAYWSWREGALDRGGWDPSDDEYVTWLESLPAVDA